MKKLIIILTLSLFAFAANAQVKGYTVEGTLWVKTNGALILDGDSLHHTTQINAADDTLITKRWGLGNFFNAESDIIFNDGEDRNIKIDAATVGSGDDLYIQAGSDDDGNGGGDTHIKGGGSNEFGDVNIGSGDGFSKVNILDDVDMGGNQIKNLSVGIELTDGVNLGQVLDSIAANALEQPADSFNFSVSPDLSGVKVPGNLYYDTDKGLTFQGTDTNVTANLEEELWNPIAKNLTGTNIENGRVVIINGQSMRKPTLGRADKSTYLTTRTIGVATQLIENGDSGRVTRFGAVTLDLSMFSEGEIFVGDSVTDTYGMTNNRPMGGDFVASVGYVIDNSVDGILLVNPYITERTAEQNLANGFPVSQRNGTTLSVNNATRYAKISPNGVEFYYYDDGIKYINSEADSVQFTDVTGLHVAYYDSDELKTISNPTSGQVAELIREQCLVSYWYWNATADEEFYIGDERHNIMDRLTHTNLHFTRGAQIPITSIQDGSLALTDIVIGNGNSDVGAQFGVTSGILIDEDLPHFSGLVLSTAGLPIYYKIGLDATAEWSRMATLEGLNIQRSKHQQKIIQIQIIHRNTRPALN